MKQPSVRRRLSRAIDQWLERLRLPPAAGDERRLDHRGLPQADSDTQTAVRCALDWLSRAQDRSASRDGGVARHYSLIDGWSVSYPETTGYIVPTVLEAAARFGDDALRERGKRMLDWLVAIQFAEGGFQGGLVDAEPRVPVTFNTGQILLGLASGVRHLGPAYLEPMRRAAAWLVETQDPDGGWRRHPSPFASPGEKSYETHVSWGLFEAARIEADPRFARAGLRNVRWALGKQEEDGWFADCSLSDDALLPLTHTLGYVLRGVLEAYRYSGEEAFLDSARKLGERLLGLLGADGFLPGLVDRRWRGAASWACLTGTVQVAHCWLLLWVETADERYLEAARAANRFVRRTVRVDGAEDGRGGVKGSFPVDGRYCPYMYCSWAAKFFVDANLLELDVEAGRLAPRRGRP